MENNPTNANAPATKADLRAEFGKFEEKLDQRLDERFSEQANVILEAVGELMEKKMDEKFDPVITKLDGIMKGVEALQQVRPIGSARFPAQRRLCHALLLFSSPAADVEPGPIYPNLRCRSTHSKLPFLAPALRSGDAF